MELRSKFNHGFTIHGYLYCAILKVWYNFKVKRASEAKGNPFKAFEIFKMFKNNLKFTEQHVELTKELLTGKATPRSWYSYVVTNVGLSI